jgi:homoserine kinase type II
MSPISSDTAETLGAVLARFDKSDPAIRDIRTGRVNKHWRIGTAAGDYVLRRYNVHRSHAAIAYEHDVLRYLAGKNWPVAAPLPTGGETIVEAEERLYALLPLLPGRPSPYVSDRYSRLKGRLLARLHEDLAGWEPPGQRETFGRVWELDVYVGAQTRYSTLNELLMDFGQEYTDHARAIRSQKYAMLRELSTLGYGELPLVATHFDFHHDNLLWSRGELTGLLDFDLAHLDARVADVAQSLAFDCLAPPAYNAINLSAARAFLGGYMDHTPLSDVELQLIVPLVRAAILLMVTWRLCQWANGEDKETLRSVERSLSYRFPSFDRNRLDLEASVLQAGSR